MLRLQKVRKEYDDVVAVDDLDLKIEAGEIFGLIGPNGAGKTTTIRMACGLLQPTAGRVSVGGLDIHQNPEAAQRYIGYLSDFFSVYEDLKVWEYLDYFAHAYKMPEADIPSRIDEVILQSGLDVKRDAFIEGLSRGMKQRLGIARAVIHSPRLLLLDEPASGLDPKARVELRNLLLSERDRGATILISSHILTELEGFCTSIGLMEKGRMVRSGAIGTIATAETRNRAVRVRWLGNPDANIESLLKGQPNVAGVMVKGAEAVFSFGGAEEQLAAILAELVSNRIEVVSFGEVKQTIEDLYMKISSHGVM